MKSLSSGYPGAASFAPLLAISAAPRAIFDCNTQAKRGIANQQGGVCALQHGARIRRHLEKPRRNLPLLVAQDSCERLRAARAAVQGDTSCLLDRGLGNNQQA